MGGGVYNGGFGYFKCKRVKRNINTPGWTRQTRLNTGKLFLFYMFLLVGSKYGGKNLLPGPSKVGEKQYMEREKKRRREEKMS